jgi:hypothetical protein
MSISEPVVLAVRQTGCGVRRTDDRPYITGSERFVADARTRTLIVAVFDGYSGPADVPPTPAARRVTIGVLLETQTFPAMSATTS